MKNQYWFNTTAILQANYSDYRKVNSIDTLLCICYPSQIIKTTCLHLKKSRVFQYVVVQKNKSSSCGFLVKVPNIVITQWPKSIKHIVEWRVKDVVLGGSALAPQLQWPNNPLGEITLTHIPSAVRWRQSATFLCVGMDFSLITVSRDLVTGWILALRSVSCPNVV